MEKHTPCIVSWVDIATPGQYWAEEKDAGVEKCTSRGFFVKETSLEITIAQTITEKTSDELGVHYGGLLSIPRGAMVKIEEEK